MGTNSSRSSPVPPQVRAKLEEWERERRAKAAPRAPKRRLPLAAQPPVTAESLEQAQRMGEAQRALVARGYWWLFRKAP